MATKGLNLLVKTLGINRYLCDIFGNSEYKARVHWVAVFYKIIING